LIDYVALSCYGQNVHACNAIDEQCHRSEKTKNAGKVVSYVHLCSLCICSWYRLRNWQNGKFVRVIVQTDTLRHL